MPFGTIIDPMFSSPESEEIVAYTRAGDSAIWSGHYLAAEAFRYKVTGSQEALANIDKVISGLRSLVDVTETNLLCRAVVPADSPFADAISREEEGNGIFRGVLDGRDFLWIGDTSRDQYSGVFFGLGTAYDLIDQPDLRAAIAELVTRMLTFLLDHHWSVVLPNGRISTIFAQRPDQQLAFLQIGRRVNNSQFGFKYRRHLIRLASLIVIPIGYDLLDDHSAYYKFNLANINLFNLIRLESDSNAKRVYLQAYRLLRRTLDDHGNAHFNMIDRQIQGPDSRRDSETLSLLAAWLKRPRRDEFIDLRDRLPSCGPPERGCAVIPVEDRVRTDFLWQRSPFLLVGGGNGRVEGAGIDFILPYWMARYSELPGV